MTKISFSSYQNTKFVLLGSGYLLCRFCNMLLENDFPKPIIVTHSKKFHKRDQTLFKNSKNYIDLFKFARENKIEIIESDNLNQIRLIKKLKKLECNAAFSISCRSIIGKEFLESFQYRVFNIHPSFLPHERGAGILSWRILNNKNYVAGTIHQIDSGIDTGNIILQEKKILKIKNKNPENYSIRTNELYEKLLLKFLKYIKNQKFIRLKKQNHKISSYFPRLYTEVNGAIDWSWTNKEIELFVNAFGFPYPGSFTYVNNKRISILEVRSQYSKEYFHPFMIGKVIQKFKNGSIKVVTKSGFLIINKVAIDGEVFLPSKVIKLSDTFFTPLEILIKSKITTTNVKNMGKPYNK